MPVYDSESIANSKSKFECTYKTFTSNNQTATPDAPILVLDNLSVAFTNDCVGTFTNPYRKTAFTMQTPDGDVFSNILLIDSRFESLIRWLGENKIKVKLTGENFAKFLKLIENDVINKTVAKEVFEAIFDGGVNPEANVRTRIKDG